MVISTAVHLFISHLPTRRTPISLFTLCPAILLKHSIPVSKLSFPFNHKKPIFIDHFTPYHTGVLPSMNRWHFLLDLVWIKPPQLASQKADKAENTLQKIRR